MRLTAIAAAIAALSLGACGKNPPMEDGTLRSHSGGFIDSHASHIRSLGDQPIRMTDRVYRSAATMYLGAQNVCVGRESRFEFHGVTWMGLTPMPEQAHDYWTQKVIAFYPEPLRDWFLSHYGAPSVGGMMHFRALTGAELIEMGAAVECAPKQMEADQ